MRAGRTSSGAKSSRRRPGPRSAQTTLPGEASSPADARHFLVETLTGWSADRYLEIATLLASELVTNAVLHTGSSTVDLCVRLLEDRVRVEVTDESSARPTPLGGGPLSATGRGLTLVEALASGWGVEPAASGKTVWFEVGQ